MVKAPVATPLLVSPTRCTDRCARLMCEVCVSYKIGEPVDGEATLTHSIYWSETRSRSKCTTRSRSRSTPQSRSSSCHSSRSFSRSSTLKGPSPRPRDTEPLSGSRTPCHHNVSRRPSQTTKSRDRSHRSPSIRRRIGSPCHLDRRRITSARRRPIAYRRAVSPSWSPSKTSSQSVPSSSLTVTPSWSPSSSLTVTPSSSSSRISFSGSESATLRQSRSFVSCTNYRSLATSCISELHIGWGNSTQRSNHIDKHSYKHRRRLQRHLIPLMPSS